MIRLNLSDNAAHGGLGQPQRPGHRAGGPVGGIRRGLLQRFGGDRLHLGISDPPGRLRSGRIGQAGEVIGDKL